MLGASWLLAFSHISVFFPCFLFAASAITPCIVPFQHRIECFHEIFVEMDIEENGTLEPPEIYEYFGEVASPFVNSLTNLIGALPTNEVELQLRI